MSYFTRRGPSPNPNLCASPRAHSWSSPRRGRAAVPTAGPCTGPARRGSRISGSSRSRNRGHIPRTVRISVALFLASSWSIACTCRASDVSAFSSSCLCVTRPVRMNCVRTSSSESGRWVSAGETCVETHRRVHCARAGVDLRQGVAVLRGGRVSERSKRDESGRRAHGRPEVTVRLLELRAFQRRQLQLCELLVERCGRDAELAEVGAVEAAAGPRVVSDAYAL